MIMAAAWIFPGLNLTYVEAQAQDKVQSLMFANAELNAISAALALRPSEITQTPGGGVSDLAPQPENKPGWRIERLHLSALIYTDAKNWTLWFDGRRVERGNVPPFLDGLHVMPDYVDLSVIATPGAAPVPVRLRPNQTFLIGQMRIAGSGYAGN